MKSSNDTFDEVMVKMMDLVKDAGSPGIVITAPHAELKRTAKGNWFIWRPIVALTGKSGFEIVNPRDQEVYEAIWKESKETEILSHRRGSGL